MTNDTPRHKTIKKYFIDRELIIAMKQFYDYMSFHKANMKPYNKNEAMADSISRVNEPFKQALVDLLLGLPELQLAKGEYERLSDKSRHKYDTTHLIRQAITTAIMGEEEHYQ